MIKKNNSEFKMSTLFQTFTEDLNLPKEIIDKIYIERTNEELKIFALSLPTLKYPDSYILAGRLFVFVNIKSCPKLIRDYIDILRPILNKNLINFILENESEIDQLLDDTYYYNFKNQNILSASSTINYLLKISADECPIETPCQMMLRQAIQFYFAEGFERVKECYYELIEQDYVHASPTMFNAGTKKNQMSSCFLLTLGDNLESLLYSGAGDVGLISKLQGGIGISMNSVRHSSISNTGKSSGVLPFAKIYDSTIKCVNQGGKRNGAMTITLNDWHIDFLEFIQCRDNYTHNGIRLKQANICAYLSNLFMERVKNDQDWTFFCPARAKIDERKLVGTVGQDFEDLYCQLELKAKTMKETFDLLDQEIKSMETQINTNQADSAYIVEYHKKTMKRVKMRKEMIDYKVMNAREIYTVLCDMNNKSSMPYIVYRDPVNLKNNMSNIGVCEGLNLCLEITEPSTPDSIASCNLGHINLKKFASKIRGVELTENNIAEYYDFKALGKASRSLVYNINKVIDYNYYPLDTRDKDGNVINRGKISVPNFANRPIGIGVSGLAEVFAHLGLDYDAPFSFYLNKLIFACIYYNSLLASLDLARKDGEYENFRTGSCNLFVEDKWQEFPGSPASNGYLQFNLWQQEAEYLRSKGILNDKIYKMEDNIAMEPTQWGQEGNWKQLRKEIIIDGLRNSMLIALMPTASSAQLLRNAETTEAHQTLVYSRKLVHGNFTAFSEPFVEDMQKHHLWTPEMIEFIMMANGSIKDIDKFIQDKPELFPDYKYNQEEVKKLQSLHRGMYEISQKDTMLMARQRGIYICQSQSLNIYLGEPDIRKIRAVHSYSNSLQLKTGMYYLRQNPASQTNRFTVDPKIQEYYSSKIDKKAVAKKEEAMACSLKNGADCLMCQ